MKNGLKEACQPGKPSN